MPMVSGTQLVGRSLWAHGEQRSIKVLIPNIGCGDGVDVAVLGAGAQSGHVVAVVGRVADARHSDAGTSLTSTRTQQETSTKQPSHDSRIWSARQHLVQHRRKQTLPGPATQGRQTRHQPCRPRFHCMPRARFNGVFDQQPMSSPSQSLTRARHTRDMQAPCFTSPRTWSLLLAACLGLTCSARMSSCSSSCCAKNATS
eukprot:365126-Chlamydomonas_euryale.AAC.47